MNLCCCWLLRGADSEETKLVILAEIYKGGQNVWALNSAGLCSPAFLGTVAKPQLCGFTGNSANKDMKKNLHRCSQYVQHLTVTRRAGFQPVGYQLCSRAAHKAQSCLGHAFLECLRDRQQPGWAADSSHPLPSSNHFLGDIICS